MNDPQQHELLRYLNRETTADEAARFEERLENEPRLGAELEAWEETMAGLVEREVAPIRPSAEIWRSLLERVRGRGGRGDFRPATAEPSSESIAETVLPFPSSERPPPSRAGWLSIAASVLAVVALARGFWVEQRLRDEVAGARAANRQLEESLAALGQRLTGTEADVDQLALVLATSSSPRTRSVVLAGLEDAPQAFGTTLVRPGEAAFFAYSLPQLSEEQDYQLWFIGDQGPVSAGTFEVDERGTARVLVSAENLEAAAQWAVTIEPEGGVPQPTGSMVLLGSA